MLWARDRRCRSSLSLYSHDSSACRAWREGYLFQTPLMTTVSGLPAVSAATAQKGAGQFVVHHHLPGQQRQACCIEEACPGRSAGGRSAAGTELAVVRVEANSLGKPRESTLC